MRLNHIFRSSTCARCGTAKTDEIPYCLECGNVDDRWNAERMAQIAPRLWEQFSGKTAGHNGEKRRFRWLRFRRDPRRE